MTSLDAAYAVPSLLHEKRIRKRKSIDTVVMALKPGPSCNFMSTSASSASFSSSLSCQGVRRDPSNISSDEGVQMKAIASTHISQKKCPATSSTLIISPSTYLTMTLKNHKIKERIDPFSLEQALYFVPYQESDIPLELLQAVRCNDLERLRTVAAQHDCKGARNQFGENLVHLTCRMGMDASILQYLVREKGVPLNVRDRFGRSPLHNACMSAVPSFDNVEFLLDHGSKMVLFEDDSGKTPLECIPRLSFDRWTRFLAERNILKRISSNLEHLKVCG